MSCPQCKSTSKPRPYRIAGLVVCVDCGDVAPPQVFDAYVPVEADYQALTRASRYAEIYESRVDELKAGQ